MGHPIRVPPCEGRPRTRHDAFPGGLFTVHHFGSGSFIGQPNACKGWIPVARTFTIAPEPFTLSRALYLLTVADLKAWVALLPEAPKLYRKRELVETLERHLAGKSLRQLWHSLDELQQSAVSEALHDPTNCFVGTRFRAKYGALPDFDVITERRRYSSLTGLSLLRLFLYRDTRYGRGNTTIPTNLQKRLRAFVPPPPEPALHSVETLPESDETPENTSGRAGDGGAGDRMVIAVVHEIAGAGLIRSFPSRVGAASSSVKSVKAASSKAEAAPPPVPLERRDMERAAQQDVLTVLRLIDHGKVTVSAKTSQASAASVRNIAAALCDDDFYDPAPKKTHSWEQTVGPIKAFAWPWLVQAAKLAVPHGTKLALTRTGRAALGAPPAETLRRLWQRWLKTTLLDEFRRIDAIKGQQRGKGRHAMTAASSRRPITAAALGECPVDRWVPTRDFSRFMQAADFEFDVTRDPWKLYIADTHYGSLGYAGHHDWHILQERYLLCLLFEYAATLGLIDVAYRDPAGARSDYTHMWGTDELVFLSRYDGLRYFRLNPLGAFCLGLAKTHEPNAPRAGTGSLTVRPNLGREVTGGALSPDERLLLETWAVAESETAWRLDGDKVRSAIESGHELRELREFLAARDDQPLPERVEGFLRTTERRARALIPRGPALLVECADAELAARLAADERTARLCLRAGERSLVVKAGSEDAFRKAVHSLGYGMPKA